MAKGSSGGFGQQIDIRIAALVIALAIGIFGATYYFLTRPKESIVIPPSPEQATIMSLNASLERLVEALTATGKAPKTVADLPPGPDGTPTVTTDEWNNEILMKVTGGGSRYVAEFRSKGADGVAGNSDDLVVDGVIEKTPNGSQFYVSAQSQTQIEQAPPPEGETSGG